MAGDGTVGRLVAVGRRWRRPLAALGAVAGAALAVLWWHVVPDEAADATGLRRLLLRYGHALVWALLGSAAALASLGNPGRLASRTAGAALLVYGAFVAATVL